MERNQAWPVGQDLTAGQLHLLRELLVEHADALTSQITEVDGHQAWTLSSTVPQLLETIGHRLERLRIDQDDFEKRWRFAGL